MPVLWQSSQRPMYVRTVWIDGFRHAILTHDDPYLQKLKRRRPHSSASCFKPTSSRLSQHSDLNDCLGKFNYTITSYRPNINVQNTHLIERLDLTEAEGSEYEESSVKDSPQSLTIDSSRVIQPKTNSMKHIRLNKTARTDAKDNTELSDRVLQWLDLAGKVDLLAPESAERMAQPRHSCPELERRNFNLTKSKTTVDIRKSNPTKTVESPKAQQTNIDRRDFFTTSGNTIENYARQSRNVKITLRNETAEKTKNKKDLKPNIAETRQKIANERNAVKKQYAELVSKKLIPDLSKNPKRQVHIFMPELPKKPLTDVTSRTESLLSHSSLKNLKQ